MGKQIIADNLTLGTQLGHSATEINGVLEDERLLFFLPFLILHYTMHILIQCKVKGKQMLTSTITEKGQTTIPAEVRKALSLKPHQRLTYEICEGGVVVRPETENLMDLAGSLKSDVPAASKAQERATARAARRGKHQ